MDSQAVVLNRFVVALLAQVSYGKGYNCWIMLCSWDSATGVLSDRLPGLPWTKASGLRPVAF